MAHQTRIDDLRGMRDARSRTLALLDGLDADLARRPSAGFMSPLVWDLAHVGNYEELWILRAVAGEAPTNEQYDDMYDAFRHERFERDELPLLAPEQARAYIGAVRERSEQVLAGLAIGDPDHPIELVRSGFLLPLVAQHEHQHDETILQSRNLLGVDAVPDGAVRTAAGAGGPGPIDHGAQVAVEAAVHEIGTSLDPRAYDNERPAHHVALDAFEIDRHPVTNARWLEFVEGGGYADDRAWSAAGAAWRAAAGVHAPMGWSRADDGSWVVTRFGRTAPLVPDEPVQHVSWYEADAFARWTGRRLPTEHEWEVAARGATIEHAVLGAEGSGPRPISEEPGRASTFGCSDVLGGVWEWTSSEFAAYPGFRAYPYREYSEVFFGRGYRVLRGGSWATHRDAIRTTFRNWDLPQRRQLFAGLRTARST
jgi:iron(II)-dependent oxidoreductase